VRLLLDTCVVSEIRTTNGDPAVRAFVAAQPTAALFLSVITFGEISKGVSLLADGAKKQALAAWLGGLGRQFEDRILPVDQESAEIWGELTGAAQKGGRTVAAADGLIAATALRHGLHVATRNTTHFAAAGVLPVNPWLAPSGQLQ
jgi:predicted nucleic acid-binding protein